MSKTKIFAVIQIVCMTAFLMMSFASGSSRKTISELTSRGNTINKVEPVFNDATDANGRVLSAGVNGYTINNVK